MARPTKLTPELLVLAKTYVVRGYLNDGSVIPTIAGLALALDISRETVHAWSRDKKNREFSDITSDLMAKQEAMLLNNGLKGDYNASIAKLMLTKHSYSDKTEIDEKSQQTVEITKRVIGADNV